MVTGQKQMVPGELRQLPACMLLPLAPSHSAAQAATQRSVMQPQDGANWFLHTSAGRPLPEGSSFHRSLHSLPPARDEQRSIRQPQGCHTCPPPAH